MSRSSSVRRPLVRPLWWRVTLAFALAPAVAALAYSCVHPFYEGLSDRADRIWRTFPLVVMVGGYAPALALGLPLFLLLRLRLHARLVTCAAAGAIVAALPWLVLLWLLPEPCCVTASVGGRAISVDGHRTWYGLFNSLQIIGEVALYGAIGGLVFQPIAAGGRRA